MDRYKVAIIGGGAAGLTAAMYTVRAQLSTIVIERSLAPGGQISQTDVVENYPGFPEGISGAELALRMTEQAERFGAEIHNGESVLSILPKEGGFTVSTDTREVYAESVILATGSTPKRLGVPGEDLFFGRGVSTCATCDGFFFRGKSVVVVGGGDAAVEEAIFLTRFASKVTVVHRRDSLRANKRAQSEAFANEKISFIWNSTIREIFGKEGKVAGVRLETPEGERTIPAEGVFVYIGHAPNVVPAGLETNRSGHVVVVDEVYTNVSGLFSAGDVSDATYRQLSTAVGSGAKAGIAVERWLAWNLSSSSQ